MWERTGSYSARNSRISVKWLDHNYGVHYRDGDQELLIPAEFGGSMYDTSGRVHMQLTMGFDPCPTWKSGNALSDDEQERVLANSKEALEFLDMRIQLSERRPEYRKWFLQSLPWGARLRYWIGEFAYRRRARSRGRGG